MMDFRRGDRVVFYRDTRTTADFGEIRRAKIGDVFLVRHDGVDACGGVAVRRADDDCNWWIHHSDLMRDDTGRFDGEFTDTNYSDWIVGDEVIVEATQHTPLGLSYDKRYQILKVAENDSFLLLRDDSGETGHFWPGRFVRVRRPDPVIVAPVAPTKPPTDTVKNWGAWS